jgi:hypothetical protein
MRRRAGESLGQPMWSPGGRLHVVSDRSGWWNLYRVEDGALRPVVPMQAEFDRPAWIFGQCMYGFEDDGHIVATFIADGVSRLGRIDVATRDASSRSPPTARTSTSCRSAPAASS